jgi:Chromo (CHRromatin Organisation MOdifier) domain
LLMSYASDNPENWDVHLGMAELAYNSSVSTSTGVSPFYALYGRNPRLPIDVKLGSTNQAVDDLVQHLHGVWDCVKANLEKAQEKQRRGANRRRRDVNYAVGDKVLVATKVFKLKLEGAHKIMRVWQGPFEVVDVPGPVNVKVKLPPHLRTHDVLHVSKVKPWVETLRFGDRGAQPSYEMVDGEQEWEVEALLARKVVNGRVSYLVKWLGYDHCENMWIRKSYLANAMDLVKEYDATHA